MAYIRADEGLGQHPKTIRVSCELGIPTEAVTGHLIKLWTWTFRNAPEGRLPKNHDFIDNIANCTKLALKQEYRRYTGKKTFTQALLDAGFLDEDGNQYIIHNWEERVGIVLTSIEAARQRKANERARRKENKQETTENVTRDIQRDMPRTSGGRHADVTPENLPSSIQHLASSNSGNSVDQKIEEEITHTHADSIGASEPEHLEEPKKTPATKPTNGANLSVIKEELKRIAEIYPNCPTAQGVNAEYIKARSSPEFPGIDKLIETIRWQIALPTWQPGYDGKPYGYTPELKNYLSSGKYMQKKPPEAESTKPAQYKKSTYTNPDTGEVLTAKPVEQVQAELRSRA